MQRILAAVALTLLVPSNAPAAEPAAPVSTGAPATPAPGTAQTASAPAQSPWRLGVALGAGGRTNPLIQSDDIPIVLDLDIAWFGERFFFDNGDGGFTFVDGATVTASVVGRVNSDRVFFGKTDAKFVRIAAAVGQATTGVAGPSLADTVELTVPDRHYAVELGVEALTDGRWGRLQVGAYRDASDTHGGYEISADYTYGWRRERWYVAPSVGFSYKSRDLNDYYWGVRPQEASAALPAYTAGSGVNRRARVAVSYQLRSHWSVAVAAEYERLNAEAAASPIVADENVLGAFVGLHYRF